MKQHWQEMEDRADEIREGLEPVDRSMDAQYWRETENLVRENEKKKAFSTKECLIYFVLCLVLPIALCIFVGWKE